MKNYRLSVRVLIPLFTVAIMLLSFAARQEQPVTGMAATPTPYHEGQPSPRATPHTMIATRYPVPAPADVASGDVMAAGGTAMILAADDMARAAETMRVSGTPELVERGEHWAQDAQALRDRGAWMVLAASAGSMVHDPDRAHELNLQNLRGNGLSMAAEGQAMIEHGQQMATEVEELGASGILDRALADELASDAANLIESGEVLVRDGERMQEDAERLLESIGQ